MGWDAAAAVDSERSAERADIAFGWMEWMGRGWEVRGGWGLGLGTGNGLVNGLRWNDMWKREAS